MPLTIAIVEDDDVIRQGLETMLESREDFKCIGAYPNAETFMKEAHKLDPDIVIMDLNLPGMPGADCISKLKGEKLRAQFLVCTVNKDDENIYKALCAGAVGYILKNSALQKLIDAIDDLQAGGSPMSAEIARKVVSSFARNQKSPEAGLLTTREEEIIGYLSKGYRYKEIADLLFISVKTVRTHIRNIYEKLQVTSRMEAVNKVFGNR